MDGPAAGALVAVGVDLDPQRGPLHPLLGGEVCAQAVHRDKDLGEFKEARQCLESKQSEEWREITH